MAAGSVGQAVRAPEMRSNGSWSEWPRRTGTGATAESKERSLIWAMR